MSLLFLNLTCVSAIFVLDMLTVCIPISRLSQNWVYFVVLETGVVVVPPVLLPVLLPESSPEEHPVVVFEPESVLQFPTLSQALTA